MEQQLPAWIFGLSFLAFPALWVIVCRMLARMGGWRRLAEAYGANSFGVNGTRFRFRSGRFGPVDYNSSLVFEAGPRGLSFAVFFLFRPGHAPFAVPWSDLRFTSTKRWFMRAVEVSFARVPGVSLTLSRGLAERLMEAGGMPQRLPPAT